MVKSNVVTAENMVEAWQVMRLDSRQYYTDFLRDVVKGRGFPMSYDYRAEAARALRAIDILEGEDGYYLSSAGEFLMAPRRSGGQDQQQGEPRALLIHRSKRSIA